MALMSILTCFDDERNRFPAVQVSGRTNDKFHIDHCLIF